MAFDGITTAALVRELSDLLTGGRITKIAQTDRFELVLTIRLLKERGGGQVRLYLSADPSLPLCYLTEKNRPSPLTAPSFCMLLRKHLQSGRILSVSQPGLERIIRFEIEHLNEMGDLCRHYLIMEIMGKHSNLIFTGEDDIIVDSIRRVSSMVSSVREVLPGRSYFIPDTTGKRDPLAQSREAFLSGLAGGGTDPARYLSGAYTGLSRQAAEEICLRASLVHDRSALSLDKEEEERLWEAFSGVMADVRSGSFSPAIYYEDQAGARVPKDFSALPMRLWSDLTTREMPSVSVMLETFYAEKNDLTRMRQKSADLRRIVQTILERDLHKYDLQCRQIKDTEKRDRFRICGELIQAYAYAIPEGASSYEAYNYYTGQTMTIRLDPTLTPQQNAQRYFARYNKLKRTFEALSTLTEKVREEIDHLSSIRTSLDLASSEGDLAQIRKELEDGGFVKTRTPSGKGRARIPAARPLHYISSDGFDIYVGKNNTQNEEVTFKIADPSDIWFHANDMPGSHVVLKARGLPMDQIPDRCFIEAAALAAWYSSGRSQGHVEIDYAERRHIKKPGGGRPGFVIYHTNYSILAGTDISMLRLAES